MKHHGRFIRLLIVSVVLVLISIFMPERIESKHELSQVAIGFPYPFIHQNQSMKATEIPTLAFIGSPTSYATVVAWQYLFINIAMMFVLVTIISGGIKFFKEKKGLPPAF